MHFKQRLLLGKLALELKLITKEQLKKCIEKQEKENIPLISIFINENLIKEENKIKKLLKYYLYKIKKENKVEKGENLVFLKRLIDNNVLSREDIKKIWNNYRKYKDEITFPEYILKENFIPLKDFISIYFSLPDELIECPGCNKKIRLVRMEPGKHLKCKNCKTIISAPPIESLIPENIKKVDTEFKKGEILEDKYEIIKKIAEGGMGKIYKAQDILSGHLVALKILKNPEKATKEDKGRFAREASTLKKLKHPYIVKLLDVGILKNKIPYLALEYIEGYTLEELIKEKQKLNLDMCIDLMLKICSALKYAHENGIIHRDLKPSNILIDSENNPYITDFGLVKYIEETLFIQQVSMISLTQTGTFLGTPCYIPPEQARGTKKGLIGPRLDIYSLGVVFYEMLTGVNPFQGENILEIFQKVLEYNPPPPSHYDPNIPKSIDKVCLKCIKKDPFQRYNYIDELIKDIEKRDKKKWWNFIFKIFSKK